MATVTDYVAAGSFADIKDNVTYLNEIGYAQLVRTVDLKKKFANSDAVYVDENAFKYLWRVNLNEECIVLPNIGANIGEVYYIEPSDLPFANNVLGPNAILLKTDEDNYFIFTSLNTDLFQNQLFENVGSSGQPKFNKTELKSIKLLIPSIEEQKKIGSYFRQLDYLITLHQRKSIPHPNHPIIHTKHKGEEKYVRIRVNDREKTNRTANLRRFPVDIPGGFKDGGGSVGEFQIHSGAE